MPTGWRSELTYGCEQCGRADHPSKPKVQRFCSVACSTRYRHGRSVTGNPMEKAISVRKRQHNDYVRAMLKVQFGTITERELDLFRFAYAQGYNRAHAKGYYAGRKLRAA